MLPAVSAREPVRSELSVLSVLLAVARPGLHPVWPVVVLVVKERGERSASVHDAAELELPRQVVIGHRWSSII